VVVPEVLKMNVEDGVEVAAPVWNCEEKVNRYGSVPGLPDDELADPYELERQVIREEFEPVLMLPESKTKNSVRPVVDESFGVDWGAFATVDFDRNRPEFDKARYKADKLREQLKDTLIMLNTVSGRLPKAQYKVLKYLRMGVIELEHISNMDMIAVAKMWLRVERLREEIDVLVMASYARQQRSHGAWLASIG
jgi:hypothetical protein